MKGTEEYVYQDDEGDDQFKVIRRPGKRFHIESLNNGVWEKGLNGKPTFPYRLPEVRAAIEAGQTIYVCEGEQDCNSAAQADMVATCNHGGAGKWHADHSEWLIGAKRVVIIWDRDDAGAQHAIEVARSLREYGVKNIVFKCAAAGKDLTDHLAEGYTESDLLDRRPKPKPKPEQAAQVEVVEDEFAPAMLQLVLKKLSERGNVTTEYGKTHQYNARCPAHDDNSPSLSISLGDRNQVLLKCFAGCSFEKIAQALGINKADLSRGDESKSYQAEVEKRARSYQISDDAKRLNARRQARNVASFPEKYRHSTADELELPDEDARYLFDSWFPSGSMVLLNADRKTGKTRLCISLAKAICDDEPFLGKYATSIPDGGKVLYLNYEMTASMMRRWLREADIKNPERLLVENLKGRSLPFNDVAVRDELAAYCVREAVVLIIFDTQIKAMADLGINENDNSEVTTFHAAIEGLVELTGGAANVLLAHHIGKSDREHGRGASRIEDGVDVIWTLTKEGEHTDLSQAVPRSLRGEGREVLQPAVELGYNLETGLYTTTGVGAAQQVVLDRYAAWCDRLREAYSASGRWPTTREARALANVGKARAADFLAEAVERGYVRRIKSRDSTAIRYKVNAS
jgi:hypothetical protein